MELLPPDMTLDQYADEFYYNGGEPKETNISRIVYLCRDWFSHMVWLEGEDGKTIETFDFKRDAIQYCKENALDLRYK